MFNTITNIILIVPIVVIGIIYIFNVYTYQRIQKVSDFRSEIIDITHTGGFQLEEELFYKRMDLADKYSFNEMLYSFKPLKLEAWYTPEEIKLMKSC